MVEHRQEHAPAHNPQIDLLYEAIGQLDKVEKALITLFLEDLSYDEIGEVLGLSPSHVGVMLHRAKKKLSLLMNGGYADSQNFLNTRDWVTPDDKAGGAAWQFD